MHRGLAVNTPFDEPEQSSTTMAAHRKGRASVSFVVAPAAPADGWTTELRGRLDELLDEYPSALNDNLDGLSEDEVLARRADGVEA